MRAIVRAARTFFSLALPYFRSEDRWIAGALLIGILAAELGLVAILIAINEWNKRFFNALEGRDWNAAQLELLVFCGIALAAVVAGMMQYFLGQRLIIRWRRWITERYVSMWMAHGRHYRVRLVDPGVDNIHLRIASDVLIFLTRTHELFTQLVGSIVTIFSFVAILWFLSAATPLPLFGHDLSFAGWLIVVAACYAVIGTLFTHLIGRPLIPLNFNQQRYEADFRFALARATDQSEPVALMGGEAVERRELRNRFTNLVHNWTRLANRQSSLVGFIAGYARMSTVFPTLVVTPAYLSGAITLGSLVQTALAFQHVEGALAYCISAYSKIAEWKAVMDRLAQFEAAMHAVDDHSASAKIDMTTRPDSRLQVDDLVLRLPSGEAMASFGQVGLAPGDRLLVSGASGAGKSSFFRALSGLWPLGEGAIHFPKNAKVFTLPQRSYFPLGSLRQAIAYPTPVEDADDEAIRAALTAVGLPHLTGRLDEEGDWPTVLAGGEQQRAAFARALLAKPDILLLDEPVSALEEDDADVLYRLLAERLPHAIVITIGRAGLLGHLHDAAIHLERGATASIEPLTPEQQAAAGG
ncbi:ABC transporter ATP-binding protein/permease [Bradyrhizobium sp. LHD-71]|uniref:ABC transporter ATP-binding protein/permease n=1 Tax=Bradyrhizobium sp. LHD-71 TaxID=3072141 RepID=UPI00280DC4D8|nr:ABC transporter ATP-binding protein/permease [Bradyrhizobium sp. LHD-71]MDQ8729055.1 ABC transporter ATP-binding protein/permease [Bradyrhizobium sp. LHD-71]